MHPKKLKHMFNLNDQAWVCKVNDKGHFPILRSQFDRQWHTHNKNLPIVQTKKLFKTWIPSRFILPSGISWKFSSNNAKFSWHPFCFFTTPKKVSYFCVSQVVKKASKSFARELAVKKRRPVTRLLVSIVFENFKFCQKKVIWCNKNFRTKNNCT